MCDSVFRIEKTPVYAYLGSDRANGDNRKQEWQEQAHGGWGSVA